MLGFGDSVTNGIGAARGYLHQVADGLRLRGSRTIFVNVSQGGRTSSEARRIAEDVALRFLPDLVVVAFGINDEKPDRKRHVPAHEFEEHIRWMATMFRVRCDSEVILVTPPPIPPNAATLYADAVRQLCADRGFALADVNSEWHPGLIAEDGAHPNDAGHRLYAEAILALLN